MAESCGKRQCRKELAAMLRASIVAAATLILLSSDSRANSVSLTPAKDNTLIQWSPETPGANPYLSNGLGDIFTGRTNQDGEDEPTISIRRGLIQFDLAGIVPDGMTIVNVTLTMRDVMGRNGDPIVSLHRVLQDWGEGNSHFNGGQGAPAKENDATWLHTFFDESHPEQSPKWETEGGDFEPAVSASSIISDDLGGGQIFDWSSPGMVSDVEAWLADPNSNFGWILIGDEAHGQTAKRFNSSESTASPNVPPVLTIEYALAGDYNDDGVVNALDYVVWRSHDGMATALDNETVTLGSVTNEDYEAWAAHFGDVEPASAAAHSHVVPEPANTALAVSGLLIASLFARNR